MERDDGVRQGYALGISLARKPGGVLRLVLDDLKLKGSLPTEWRRRSFFTYIDIDEVLATSFRLSQGQYRAIGELVVARLLALNEPDDRAPDRE